MFGRTPWPRVGLMTDPKSSWGTGTAHATISNHEVALCGAPTPFLGKSWPNEHGYWILPYLRCPACARHTYPEIDTEPG